MTFEHKKIQFDKLRVSWFSWCRTEIVFG